MWKYDEARSNTEGNYYKIFNKGKLTRIRRRNLRQENYIILASEGITDRMEYRSRDILIFELFCYLYRYLYVHTIFKLDGVYLSV